MLFSDIAGLPHIKKHLIHTANQGRIPHAQLFVGPEGSGLLPLAIAYAQYVLCQNQDGENLGGNESCNLGVNRLTHPDLHFAFPVATNEKIKKHPISNLFLEEWREFIQENPYGSLFEWYKKLGIENKQGQLGVEEAKEIAKALALKSFEAGFKVMIIWRADKMNTSCSNKLLKLIEEPPEKTLLLLIAEEEGAILQTIRSRCQILQFPPLTINHIAEGLMKKEGCSQKNALLAARKAQGDFNTALHLIRNDNDDALFEKWFITWVRGAFKAKGNKAAIRELLDWSENIAATGRETQKEFLLFCLSFFRQAMLQNYNTKKLVFLDPQTPGFSLEKFAPFVHENNIIPLYRELQDAIYHIERNGNSKIILTDLSIKLTRLIHQKSY